VQDRIADRMHACAYDRAGLGLSDPGPEPRDSRAVAADLKALMEASNEKGPFILVAHSMAPVHAYLFALQNPGLVSGLVLVDGTPPEAMTDPKIAGMVKSFGVAAALAPLAARVGLLWAADPFAGDPIGLEGRAAADKREAFASSRHNHWGAVEARDWLKDAAEARALGELSRELPVAVISATPNAYLRAALEEPARRSRRGYIEHVPGANHATLLGPKFCDAVIRGIEFVKRQAAPVPEPASVFAPSPAAGATGGRASAAA
jgi:pimeloyl-ACP methyl ester carboxylesterase